MMSTSKESLLKICCVTLMNAVEIPVMSGRDAFDLNFYSKDGSEYLTIDGQSYISEDAVQPILGGKSVNTIPSNGQANMVQNRQKLSQ